METDHKKPLKGGNGYCYELNVSFLRAALQPDVKGKVGLHISQEDRRQLLLRFPNRHYEPGLTDEVISSWLYRFREAHDLSELAKLVEGEVRKELPLQFGIYGDPQTRSTQAPKFTACELGQASPTKALSLLKRVATGHGTGRAQQGATSASWKLVQLYSFKHDPAVAVAHASMQPTSVSALEHPGTSQPTLSASSSKFAVRAASTGCSWLQALAERSHRACDSEAGTSSVHAAAPIKGHRRLTQGAAARSGSSEQPACSGVVAAPSALAGQGAGGSQLQPKPQIEAGKTVPVLALFPGRPSELVRGKATASDAAQAVHKPCTAHSRSTSDIRNNRVYAQSHGGQPVEVNDMQQHAAPSMPAAQRSHTLQQPQLQAADSADPLDDLPLSHLLASAHAQAGIVGSTGGAGADVTNRHRRAGNTGTAGDMDTGVVVQRPRLASAGTSAAAAAAATAATATGASADVSRPGRLGSQNLTAAAMGPSRSHASGPATSRPGSTARPSQGSPSAARRSAAPPLTGPGCRATAPATSGQRGSVLRRGPANIRSYCGESVGPGVTLASVLDAIRYAATNTDMLAFEDPRDAAYANQAVAAGMRAQEALRRCSQWRRAGRLGLKAQKALERADLWKPKNRRARLRNASQALHDKGRLLLADQRRRLASMRPAIAATRPPMITDLQPAAAPVQLQSNASSSSSSSSDSGGSGEEDDFELDAVLGPKARKHVPYETARESLRRTHAESKRGLGRLQPEGQQAGRPQQGSMQAGGQAAERPRLAERYALPVVARMSLLQSRVAAAGSIPGRTQPVPLAPPRQVPAGAHAVRGLSRLAGTAGTASAAGAGLSQRPAVQPQAAAAAAAAAAGICQQQRLQPSLSQMQQQPQQRAQGLSRHVPPTAPTVAVSELFKQTVTEVQALYAQEPDVIRPSLKLRQTGGDDTFSPTYVLLHFDCPAPGVQELAQALSDALAHSGRPTHFALNPFCSSLPELRVGYMRLNALGIALSVTKSLLQLLPETYKSLGIAGKGTIKHVTIGSHSYINTLKDAAARARAVCSSAPQRVPDAPVAAASVHASGTEHGQPEAQRIQQAAPSRVLLARQQREPGAQEVIIEPAARPADARQQAARTLPAGASTGAQQMQMQEQQRATSTVHQAQVAAAALHARHAPMRVMQPASTQLHKPQMQQGQQGPVQHTHGQVCGQASVHRRDMAGSLSLSSTSAGTDSAGQPMNHDVQLTNSALSPLVNPFVRSAHLPGRDVGEVEQASGAAQHAASGFQQSDFSELDLNALLEQGYPTGTLRLLLWMLLIVWTRLWVFSKRLMSVWALMHLESKQ